KSPIVILYGGPELDRAAGVLHRVVEERQVSGAPFDGFRRKLYQRRERPPGHVLPHGGEVALVHGEINVDRVQPLNYQERC
ncbi:MAG: hypothetical protein JWR49_3941, partial [Tardiphaga sp.]|nr:hypothetical protein [Tardiphaga sp.]